MTFNHSHKRHKDIQIYNNSHLLQKAQKMLCCSALSSPKEGELDSSSRILILKGLMMRQFTNGQAMLFPNLTQVQIIKYYIF